MNAIVDDLTIAAARDAVGYLTAWGDSMFAKEKWCPGVDYNDPSTQLKAVRIMCNGVFDEVGVEPDTHWTFSNGKYSGSGRITEICANKEDVVFKGGIMDISERVGMPICGRKYPIFFKDFKTRDQYQEDTIASSLYRNWDYIRSDVGRYTSEWVTGLGQGLLVCPDGRELTKEHVEVLYAFSEAGSELVSEAGELRTHNGHVRKIFMDAHFNPASFERFWHLYSMAKCNDPTWRGKAPELDLKGAAAGGSPLGERLYGMWRKLAARKPDTYPPEREFTDWDFLPSPSHPGQGTWELRGKT